MLNRMEMTLCTNISAVILVSVLVCSFAVQSVGAKCITEDGKNGTCIEVARCSEALQKIKNGLHPKICHYMGLEPIVCCSERSQEQPLMQPAQTQATRAGDDIAKRKCTEYLKPNLLLEGCTDPEDERCFLAFNGIPTIPKEYVHMAAVGFGEYNEIKWLCGGSLISEKFVLTVAHCLYSRDFGAPRWVRLGDLNLANNKDDANAKTYAIKANRRHPQWNSTLRINDIALLELRENVTMSEYVKPACLPEENSIPGRLTATGWGVTEFGGNPSDHLLKVTLMPYDYNRCHEIFVKERIDNETQLCIGSTEEVNQDTCPGDSGGPLQVRHPVYKKYHVILGLTSFGKACGQKNVPAIYTRVYHYIPWIASIVWPK